MKDRAGWMMPNLLQELFYKVRMEEDENSRIDARAIVERIDSFKKRPKEEIQSLVAKIPKEDKTYLEQENLDKIKNKRIRILYVGGDQKQVRWMILFEGLFVTNIQISK